MAERDLLSLPRARVCVCVCVDILNSSQECCILSVLTVVSYLGCSEQGMGDMERSISVSVAL